MHSLEARGFVGDALRRLGVRRRGERYFAP